MLFDPVSLPTSAQKAIIIGGVSIGVLLCGYVFCKRRNTKPINPTTPVDEIKLVDKYLDDDTSPFMSIFRGSGSPFMQPELICSKIKRVPSDIPIKLILTTNGGNIVGCEKILKALKKHPAGYNCYIRKECYSAGTLLALGANTIIMNEDSYLGKIDPQITFSTTSNPVQATILAQIPENLITGENYAQVQMSRNVVNYELELLDIIWLKEHQVRKEVENRMLFSNLPHCKLFDAKACEEIGLTVRPPADSEMNYFA